MAAVEENDAFILTETRLTQLHGGEGEREAMGQAGAFGQALALFWSADTRRGAFDRAYAPCGETLLRRSAMTVTDGFLKTAIQCTMLMTVSDISTCQSG